MLADQFDLAEKFIWAGSTIPVAIGFSWGLWKSRDVDNPALRRIITAITLVAIASSVYIGYWTVWRIAVATGNADFALYLIELAIYFTLPAGIVTLIGYSLHIHSWISKPEVLGQNWWKYLTVYAFLVSGAGVLTSILVSPDGLGSDRRDAAEQFARVGFALPTAMIYAFRMWKNRSSDSIGLLVMFGGIALVALGVAGHSAAWTTIIFLDPTRLEIVNAPFTGPPALLVAIGYSFHIYNWISSPRRLGRRWWAFVIPYIVSLWVLGFFIPVLGAWMANA